MEAGAVRIHSQGNRCAFLERALPPDVGMVVARLNPGNDSGQTWGSGLGVGSGESFLRVNLRAVEGRAGVDRGLMQMLDPAPVAPGQETWLRIRLTEDSVFFEASSRRRCLGSGSHHAAALAQRSARPSCSGEDEPHGNGDGCED